MKAEKKGQKIWEGRGVFLLKKTEAVHFTGHFFQSKRPEAIASQSMDMNGSDVDTGGNLGKASGKFILKIEVVVRAMIFLLL